MARLSIRIDLSPRGAFGPGKARLLELVDETGSISAAGRAMDMSYRRAWLLVAALNRMFEEPVVTTKLGGKAGGGAALTSFGRELTRRYRALEAAAAAAAAPHVAVLEGALRRGGGKGAAER